MVLNKWKNIQIESVVCQQHIYSQENNNFATRGADDITQHSRELSAIARILKLLNV